MLEPIGTERIGDPYYRRKNKTETLAKMMGGLFYFIFANFLGGMISCNSQ